MNGETEPPYISYDSHLEHASQPQSLDETINISQQLSRLIFLSYRFSQGGIGTQNRMLLYIEENHQPELFDPSVIEEVKKMTIGMVGNYFLNEKLHPATAIPWEENKPDEFTKSDSLVKNELQGLFERFYDRDQLLGFNSDTKGIAESVIVMDHDYLSRKNGRASSSESLKTRVGEYYRDPFESQFVKYGVLKEPTKTVEFDDIFNRITMLSTIKELDDNTINKLLEVLDVYIREHSDKDKNKIVLSYKGQCEEILNGK